MTGIWRHVFTTNPNWFSAGFTIASRNTTRTEYYIFQTSFFSFIPSRQLTIRKSKTMHYNNCHGAMNSNRNPAPLETNISCDWIVELKYWVGEKWDCDLQSIYGDRGFVIWPSSSGRGDTVVTDWILIFWHWTAGWIDNNATCYESLLVWWSHRPIIALIFVIFFFFHIISRNAKGVKKKH